MFIIRKTILYRVLISVFIIRKTILYRVLISVFIIRKTILYRGADKYVHHQEDYIVQGC